MRPICRTALRPAAVTDDASSGGPGIGCPRVFVLLEISSNNLGLSSGGLVTNAIQRRPK